MKRKKMLHIPIILLIMLALGGIYILAEEDPEYVSGIYNVFSKNADYAKISEKSYNPVSGENIENFINISVTGCESKKCSVSLNGTVIGYLAEGDSSFNFSGNMLIDGKNEIKVLLTAGSETFDGSKKYGEYNLDDIIIKSVSIKLGVQDAESPSEMIRYMPVSDSADVTPSLSQYSENQQVGDGWNNETKLGGSTPNVPLYIDYVFEKPSTDITYFSINTTEFEDGIYDIDLYINDSVIETRKIKIDNTAPELKLSFNNGDVIANSNIIKFTAVDEMAVTLNAEVDNIPVTGNSLSLKSFTEGSHNLYLIATDSLGNKVERMYTFFVERTIPDYSLVNNNGTATLTIPANANAKIYSVDLIGRINMYFNRIGPYSMTGLRSSDEVLASFADKQDVVTEAVGNSIPYQSFVVETGENTGDAVISYSGETGSSEDILLQGWNYKKSSWDTLARAESGVSISFMANIATYSKDGKMRIKASPYIISNGSDTMLWLSDPQYYSRYSDLNQFYTDIMNYAKNEYITGNIAYVANTGDIVDQTEAGDAEARKQFSVASGAQAILDKALIPNGVVSGNHDIKHDKADYTYFCEYFGSKRYEDFEWYGGNYKNNTHHYDLISMGNYDFLLLYLGCYDEASTDTVEWANAVIRSYNERNVIILTHEYILPSGKFQSDRAEVIWNEIVVPNENVKMVLCGHSPGAADQLRRVEGTDRYVLEILADYQYAELNNEVKHVENNCTCDGEGFIRLMSFNEAGQVISTTYSPSADKYNYYPSYVDSFVYDLELIPSVRSIRTTTFNVGVNIKEEGVFGVDKINLPDSDGLFAVITEDDIEYTTEILTLRNKVVTYPVIADTKNYDRNHERYEIIGMRGVYPSLRRGESNTKPSEKLVETGLDLIPSETNKTKRLSGVADYIPTYTEDGRYTVKFNADSVNTWVTTGLSVNKKVDISTYNRLYFGVTTDMSAKWNITVNFSGGYSINFSQSLYELFGYDDYCVPSDIQGTWQGYIPLDKYLKFDSEITVTGVYFTAATTGTPVTFDYFFLGRSLGEEVLFITEEDITYSIDVLSGEKVEQIPNPKKNGYVFTGWFTDSEGGEAVNFPAKIGNDGLTVFARFTKKDSVNTNAGAVFFNNEVEILPGTDYNEMVIYSFICLTLLAGIIAALVSTIRHKKKKQRFEL
ncbi:MAG: InlB B-repeat-containing protein [Eubacteriales bacterium]|nr:InlB B-repeat-containing protein [Eubacteriales bacterium]